MSSIVVSEIFHAIQGEGVWTGTPSFFLRTAGCSVKCRNCFHGNSPITMADFSRKKISEIKVGESIISYDLEKNEFITKPVINVMKSMTREIFRLATESNDVIFVTGEHPFLVRDKGWVEAKNLTIGEKIIHLSRSEIRRIHNPMFDEKSVKKGVETKRRLNIVPWNIMSEESRNDIREKARNRMILNNPMKNSEIAIKGFLNRKDRGKMSCIEKRFLEIGRKFGLKFVGDGSLIVGNRCPDFVIEGTNKLIETWASDQTGYFGRNEHWIEKRRKIFENEGYEVEFIPIHSVKNLEEEKEVERKISEYARNGSIVKSIVKITPQSNPKIWAAIAGKISNDLEVFNLEVEGTHTYLVDQMVVHNCDTIYSWAKEREEGIALKIYNEIEVEDLVLQIVESNLRYVVFTGGEPAEQATTLAELTKNVNLKDRYFTIETSGNVNFNPTFVHLLSISPKMPGMMAKSTDLRATYAHLQSLIESMFNAGRMVQLKYVIANENDFRLAKELTNWAVPEKWRNRIHIIFQPNNAIFSEVPDRVLSIAQYASNYKVLSGMIVNDVMRGGIWDNFPHVKLLMQNHWIGFGREKGT